jgi:hypothetical protein
MTESTPERAIVEALLAAAGVRPSVSEIATLERDYALVRDSADQLFALGLDEVAPALRFDPLDAYPFESVPSDPFPSNPAGAA